MNKLNSVSFAQSLAKLEPKQFCSFLLQSNRNYSNKSHKSDRVALITGSTSGIGLGIAERFASYGHTVVINGFGPQESINASIEKLKKLGKLKIFGIISYKTKFICLIALKKAPKRLSTLPLI